MEPWQSWAAAICIGGAAFWYYAKDSKYFMKVRERRASSITDPITAPAPKRRNERHAQHRKDTSTKSNLPATYAEAASTTSTSNPPNTSKKRKAGRSAPAQNVSITSNSQLTVSATDGDEAIDEMEDDQEWARQLDASRKGVTIGSSKAANKQKTPSKRPNESSAPAPLPNGDISTHRSGDVSDMLEPKPAGPSSIRVTGTAESKPKQAAKAAAPQETKKQRQNRRKAEEKKIQREEDEKKRQALLENQRRSAREARGEPAKNGFQPASPPTKTVWTSSVQSGGQPNGSAPATMPVMTSNETQLLDTFEHDGLSTSSSNDMNTNATTPATAASVVDQDLPSEEAQLEMLDKLNENSNWNEVPSKGKRGKKKQPSQPTGTATPLSTTTTSNSKDTNPFSAISTNDVLDTSEPAEPAAGSKPNGATNGTLTLEEATKYARRVKGHPDDSDWVVF